MSPAYLTPKASLERSNLLSNKMVRQPHANGELVEPERVMVLGSNLHSLFNDNNEEAKILAFQLEALNNHLNETAFI